MARWVIKNDVSVVEKLKDFDLDGYEFKERLKNGTFVFDRKKPEPKSAAKKRKIK